MYNREEMKKLLGARDWLSVEAFLKSSDESLDVTIDTLIEDVVRTGCLILQHSTQQLQKKRDKFSLALESFVSLNASSESVEYLKEHMVEAAHIESAYKEILSSLDDCAISAHAVDVQIWAVIDRAVEEIQFVREKFEKYQMKQTKEQSFTFLHPLNMKIPDDAGDLYHADSIVDSFVEGLGNTLKMLAYREGLFADDLVAIPPRPGPSTAELTFQAGSTYYYASSWNLVETGSEHIRFFDEELEVVTQPTVPANPEQRKALVFHADLTMSCLLRIARLRFDQRVMQNHQRLLRLENPRIKDPREMEVPLAPDGFVSLLEVHTLITLEDVFHFPMSKTQADFGGLKLVEWLRAYSILERFYAHTESGQARNGIVDIDLGELHSLMGSAGMSPDKTDAFLRAVTFSKSSLDLFDAPILCDSDGHYMMFASAYLSVSLPHVIASQLASQGLQVDKGKEFEKSVRKTLQEAGLHAVGFKYEVDDISYDCDAAFVWDDQLFVLECKNYSLPMGGPSDEYFFQKKLAEAASQVMRIAKQLEDDPPLVQKHLGSGASWKAVHPVVLNAFPVSLPSEGNPYFYDSSALGRFFENGQIGFIIDSPPSSAVKMQMKLPVVSLWAGNKPNASDLIAQMKHPVQISAIEGSLRARWHVSHASSTLRVAMPTIRTVTVAPDDFGTPLVAPSLPS
jgi:hypothetical protein